MSTRVGERVDDWTDRPFSGGYRELQGLAESDFSGVVRAGGAELFMTRGTVVGIHRGSIDDFEDGSGTLYKAPADALPLLAIMQERSDEVRAEYYSEDTAISEVDRTLESGGFTGFIELSENVLSGDYYLVYHQGHSMAIAYVGNSQQLLTDDEAFERADDEVGIYQVRPVDIEPIEIPEPPEPEPDPEPEPEPAPSTGVPIDDPEPTETTETVADPSTEEPVEPARSTDPVATPDPEPTDTTEAASEVSERAETTADESDATADVSTTDHTASEAEPGPVTDETEADAGDDEVSPPVSPEPERSETSQPESTEPEQTARESSTEDTVESTTDTTESVPEDTTVGPEQPGTSSETDRKRTVKQAAATQTEPASTDHEPASSTSGQEDTPPAPTPTESNEADAASSVDERSGAGDEPSSLETRAIPSLDPERTSTRNGSDANGPRRDAPARADESAVSAGEASVQSGERHEQSSERTAQTETGQRQQTATSESTHRGEPEADESTAEPTAPDDSPEQAGSQPASSAPATEPDGAVNERIEELQELLDERETEIKRLESSLESAESERDSVRRELKAVREERDELSEQVEKLESELQRLEDELGAATDAQQRMTPQEALSGTDIFVRYRSKGDATLEKAHQSGAVKKDVVENLRLEKHTQFDADISAVGGREYGEFLEDTVAFEFVTWIVEDLIFEIQGTGHTDGLSELYDALPKINRIELNGAVNVTYTEDGQETQGTESFDIVFRERMGDPLLVANINDSRQGASQAMMEDLITAAERVGRSSDQFASAFLVTESFFEPEALETVAAATRGGILSRDKRKSFVNLSRKRGYHLCLVEARNQNFHLEVPEL